MHNTEVSVCVEAFSGAVNISFTARQTSFFMALDMPTIPVCSVQLISLRLEFLHYYSTVHSPASGFFISSRQHKFSLPSLSAFALLSLVFCFVPVFCVCCYAALSPPSNAISLFLISAFWQLMSELACARFGVRMQSEQGSEGGRQR